MIRLGFLLLLSLLAVLTAGLYFASFASNDIISIDPFDIGASIRPGQTCWAMNIANGRLSFTAVGYTRAAMPAGYKPKHIHCPGLFDFHKGAGAVLLGTFTGWSIWIQSHG